MAFTQPSYAVNNVQQLADIVQGQSTALKTTFDKTGLDTKTFLIALLAELEAATASASLGASPVATGAGSTVQSNLAFTYAAIVGVVLGQIPNNSLTVDKFAFDPATQTELDSVAAKIIGSKIYAYNNIGGAF